MKNILIITGSPRFNGNSNRLALAFKEGAMANGNNVFEFDCATKHIKPCVACDGCWSNGKPCVFADDSLELEEFMFKADVIVFVSPVYWFSFTSQIKLAIDKLYPYIARKTPKPLKIKKCYLLTSAHDNTIEVFNGTVTSYLQIAKYMKWRDAGQVLVSGVNAVGDIEDNPALVDAYNLGHNV